MARSPQSTTETNPRVLLRWFSKSYLKPHVWVISLALLLMAIEGSMLGALSYMIQPLFDRVFIAADRAAVTWVALAVFVIFGIRALTGFGQRVLIALVGLRVTGALQRGLVGHMMTLDSLYFQDNAPGALIERVRGDSQIIQLSWATIVMALGRDVIGLLSLFAVALSIDWVWTLIAVAGAPIFVIPVLILQRLIRTTTRAAREASSRISTRLDEVFHGINPIKLNTLEAHESKRFGDTISSFVRSQLRSEAGQAGVPALMDIVAGLGFLGVLIYGGFQIIGGEKTVGEFMSFFTAMALIFEPLRRLANVSGALQAALASLERLYAVFAEKPGILSPADPMDPPQETAKADIQFDDVHFGYGDAPVLNGLSFTAEAGKTTALVGASGAGKSTVFNVMTRLVEPQSGTVTIGDLAVGSLDLPALRRQFSVVTQDAMLFDESLKDNITLGRPNAGQASLSSAVSAAYVDDFAQDLPEGLDSPAGPRGSNLSGGQRQRVAIARAVLRDAPILLLDEPTSALDAKSEAAVQKALDNLSQGRTTLVIAHRLATILHADKIVVMDKGRVVDQGTHAELLKRDGLYAGLYRLQFKD